VTLLSGPALTLESPGGTVTLAENATATIPTRLPARTPTDNAARCRKASARPATTEPPEAAVDGSEATSWLGERPRTRLTVDLGRPIPVQTIAITRPSVLAVSTGMSGTDDHARTRRTRSAGELVSVSANGSRWRTVARVRRPALRDVVSVRGRAVRYVRIAAIGDASQRHPLVVGELAVEPGGR
jgi:hypothetical protein